ncbi:LpqN/LpqT family lipoprotein [Nocardia sp. NPDC050406]|uniref:LpqN/LpqT family lipoprotein n=1 Tax=Nocardia sp. NPDC050406 TaxID=3364318 RepID=UPI0037BD29B6
MTTPTGPDELLSIVEYLTATGIQVAPVDPETPGAPKVSFPIPDGWQQLDAASFPGTSGVWATAPEDGWADNAVLMIARFSQPVDPATLLACGFTDARRLPEWNEIDTHTGDFDGFPSSAVTGTYVVTPLTLWAYNRYIVVDTADDQYLVQLTVTVRTDRDGAAASAIVAGLSVTV